MIEERPEDAAVLKARISELEKQLAEESQGSFWSFDTWQNTIKSLSLPLALIIGLFAFWDIAVLGAMGRDSASIAQVKENIETIQIMDQEIYVLQEEGKDGRANAKEAAVIARRDRIVAETYDHWLGNPSYFRPAELQILTHHLILQYRTTDALKVFETYWPTRTTSAQKAEGKLLEARIYAREGPIQDADKAIDLLKQAFGLTEAIADPSEKLMVQGQIVYKRGLTEIRRDGGCDTAEPFVEVLEEMATRDASGISASSAADLRTQFTASCIG